MGDEAAALRRAAILTSFPWLRINNDVIELSDLFIAQHVVPPTSVDDALHLAVACYHDIDVICTWNLRHLANEVNRKRLQLVCGQLGISVPRISTPEELMELDP